MSVNLSIKNVPNGLAAGLRARAARNRRSLQKELLVILEEAVHPADRLTAQEILKAARKLRLRTGADSARWIRTERDAR